MTPSEALAASPQPELLARLDALETEVEGLLECADARAWALPPEGRVRALERLARACRVADAAHLALVRSTSPADAAGLGGATVAGLLAWRLRVPHGRAARDVAAAAATDPERGPLPQVGAALAEGEITVEHVDVAVRTLDHLPIRLREEHAPAVDGFLAEQSRTLRPKECEHLAGQVLDRLDHTRADAGFDPDAHARRHLTLTTDRTGMVLVRGQLDPVAGAQLKAAVDHYAAPAPATDVPRADGQGSLRVVDERTPGQRRADALGTLARQGLAPGASERRGGEPPRIMVHATTDQLLAKPGAGRAVCEQTGTIAPAVLRRMQDDAALQAVLLAPSGAVLRLGRSTRCITPAQRRAILGRDLGCVVPHCDAPAAQLEGHHVQDWAAGGLTDVDAMVLACGPHHTSITVGTWAVRMVDGVPQVRAPGWVDPAGHWLGGGRRAPLTAAHAPARAAPGCGWRPRAWRARTGPPAPLARSPSSPARASSSSPGRTAPCWAPAGRPAASCTSCGATRGAPGAPPPAATGSGRPATTSAAAAGRRGRDERGDLGRASPRRAQPGA